MIAEHLRKTNKNPNTQEAVDSSSFHVKQHTTGKVQFMFFRRFLLVLTKFSFQEEDGAIGNFL